MGSVGSNPAHPSFTGHQRQVIQSDSVVRLVLKSILMVHSNGLDPSDSGPSDAESLNYLSIALIEAVSITACIRFAVQKGLNRSGIGLEPFESLHGGSLVAPFFL